MKKLLNLIAVSMVAMVLAGGLAGCGNSQNGDSQKPNGGQYGAP